MFKTLVGREDIHDRLGEIKAPALVIHGSADAAIGMEAAQRLSSGLANSRPLVAIEGAGHASNLTHPELVNLAAQQFLGEIAAMKPRLAERRTEWRRSEEERREGERREPVRATAGRRVVFAYDRRTAERREQERRESGRIFGLWSAR
jgi:hypothetical protein